MDAVNSRELCEMCSRPVYIFLVIRIKDQSVKHNFLAVRPP